LGLGLLVLSELMVGLSIGLSMRLLESALHVLGLIFANQSGLSAALLFDPTQHSQGSIYGTFLSLCFATVIVAGDLHLRFLEAAGQSYNLFEIGAFAKQYGNLTTTITRAAGDAFKIGVQMSAPFLVVGILFNLAAGILSRLMPQMQVFFILMPAQILLHSVIFLLTSGIVIWWFTEYYTSYFSNVFSA